MHRDGEGNDSLRLPKYCRGPGSQSPSMFSLRDVFPRSSSLPGQRGRRRRTMSDRDRHETSDAEIRCSLDAGVTAVTARSPWPHKACDVVERH